MPKAVVRTPGESKVLSDFMDQVLWHKNWEVPAQGARRTGRIKSGCASKVVCSAVTVWPKERIICERSIRKTFRSRDHPRYLVANRTGKSRTPPEFLIFVVIASLAIVPERDPYR